MSGNETGNEEKEKKENNVNLCQLIKPVIQLI
jgi:hypothetical protein